VRAAVDAERVRALALERGFEQDLQDVVSMYERGLVEPDRLRALFDEIEPALFRYPAIDPADFRAKVEGWLETLA
jgi:hypothetical protein